MREKKNHAAKCLRNKFYRSGFEFKFTTYKLCDFDFGYCASTQH